MIRAPEWAMQSHRDAGHGGAAGLPSGGARQRGVPHGVEHPPGGLPRPRRRPPATGGAAVYGRAPAMAR